MKTKCTFDSWNGLKVNGREVWNPAYNDRADLERACPKWANLPVAEDILKALEEQEGKKSQGEGMRAEIAAALEGKGLKVLSFYGSEIRAKFPDGQVRTWTVSDLDTQVSEWFKNPYDKAMKALRQHEITMSQPVDEDRYWNDDYNG